MTILSDPDTTIVELTDEAILCESELEKDLGRPPHEAHWYAICPCGKCPVKAMCETRRVNAQAQDGWWCQDGCNGNHPYAEIRWVPIR